MLIRKKIQYAVLALVTITAVAIWVQLSATLAAARLQRASASLANVQIKLLSLRRHEKDFLARKDPAYLDQFNATFEKMSADLQDLRQGYSAFFSDDNRVTSAAEFLDKYRAGFEAIVAATKTVGLTPEDGLTGKLRRAVLEAQAIMIKEKSDSMLRLLLPLRIGEKDFMLQRDDKHSEKFTQAYDEFMKNLQTRTWPAQTRTQVAGLIDEYRDAVLALMAQERKIGLRPKEGLLGQMRENLHKLEALFGEIGTNLDNASNRRILLAEILQVIAPIGMLVLIFLVLGIIAKRIVGALNALSTGMRAAHETKDLSLRVDIRGNDEFATAAAAFNLLTQEYEKIVSSLSRSSLSLSSTASELSIITENTNRGVNRQYQESDQVATAMNQMAATVQEVARHASAAAKASHDASEHAMHGKDVVTHAGNGLRALAGEVKNTADAIAQLEKESNDIGTVLSVIQGIAEQTNLLALNAAIEAARAGESGRGFAVVADEVRTLAQRSKESTEEIKAIIERLQAVARTAVQAMDAGLKQSTVAVEQAEAAGSALEQIADAVIQINDMNSQIATAAEEQSAVAETINQSVTTIASVSDETAKMAKQTLDTGNRLATLAMDLHQAIGIFKLSGQTLDLSKAKAAHLAWKAKLRSFLDGKQALTLEEAVSHKHCVLGKWYYGEGLEKFGNIQAMRDVEAPHAEMHGLIKSIIEQQQAGKRDAAEDIFKKVGPLSERIVALLDEVERAVNAGGEKKSA